MTDEQKVSAIKDIYSYTKELYKKSYSTQNGITYEPSSMMKNILQVEENGGREEDYFKYQGITNGLKTNNEKINALMGSDMSNEAKKAIYKSTIGEKDTTYNLLEKANANIDEYLRYKMQDIKADKDANGKSITNSKKNKIYDYLGNTSMSYEERLLIAGSQYKLTNSEKEYLANYIVNLPITSDEKIDMVNQLDKNFKFVNGNITW